MSYLNIKETDPAKLVKQAYEDQKLRQAEAAEVLKEIEEEVAKQTPDDPWTSQEYLKKEKIRVSVDRKL